MIGKLKRKIFWIMWLHGWIDMASLIRYQKITFLLQKEGTRLRRLLTDTLKELGLLFLALGAFFMMLLTFMALILIFYLPLLALSHLAGKIILGIPITLWAGVTVGLNLVLLGIVLFKWERKYLNSHITPDSEKQREWKIFAEHITRSSQKSIVKRLFGL